MSTINIVFWQKSCHVRYDASIPNVVTTGVVGFEPTMRESTSLVLPLGYTVTRKYEISEISISKSPFLGQFYSFSTKGLTVNLFHIDLSYFNS